MRTLFRAGFAPLKTAWAASPVRLGQGDEFTPPTGAIVTLTKEDRDALLEAISGAVAKGNEIDVFIALNKDEDPLLDVLGADQARFWAVSEAIAPKYNSVAGVFERLEDPEPAAWVWPSDDETRDITDWIAGIDEMYDIYLRHRHAPEPPAPGPAQPPAPGKPPTILGLPQDQFLMGSAAVIGLGALIYAVAA